MSQPVPVVVWFYGGAYLFGSKSEYDPTKLPFYDGDGFINTATYENGQSNSMIYVRGNYRLGGFGWLAGDYMEKFGQPNAGLLDQRSILRFVQDHIGDVNGDPTTVSVWGESAGASSIMHHLAMPLNVKQPLFTRAILQSPAYQWLWNRTGDLNDTFTQFAQAVAAQSGCLNADMKCIRSANTTVLQQVNQNLFQTMACQGIMPVGPSVDGNLVPTLAVNAFTNSNVMALNSIAVSHVDLEVAYSNSTDAVSFIPRPIRAAPQSEAAFQDFLSEVFTGVVYSSIRNSISTQYPTSAYSDQIARAAAVITDSSFTCNTRHIIDSYLGSGIPVYALDYAVFSEYNASTHASDLLPDFSNSQVDYKQFLKCISNKTGIALDFLVRTIQKDISPGLQQYFTDHAIWGNPNYNVPWYEYHWLQANTAACPSSVSSGGTCVWNLMKPKDTYVKSNWEDNKGADVQTPSGVCDFWKDIAGEIAKISGQGAVEHFQKQVIYGQDEL
jgi:carboxylesterase type B